MKLWGGRFGRRRDPDFERFSESFSVDWRLIRQELAAGRAYVNCLQECGVLSGAEAGRLRSGLEAIARHVESHPGWWRRDRAEDVHTWVEARLEREAGEAARKFRTGRSRNDLVATTTRLYVREAASSLQLAAIEMLEALLRQARKHARTLMPGYTHLQPAQPIVFGHYLLAYFEMFTRDFRRFGCCRERADELPLGVGALAGTTFNLDRRKLARSLGFRRVARNSLDTTSDRDFVCETVFAGALAMTHLSRLAEDLIIFSSSAFGFVEVEDRYATGSSLMPQKKNPDSLELIRGRTAQVLGKLAGIMALIKALPLAYDRDLQEDKPMLFETVDTTVESMRIAARVVGTLHVHEDRMREATRFGFLTATDLADELVRAGAPFAEAHEQVGRLVRYCAARRCGIDKVSDAVARRFIPAWSPRLRGVAAEPARAAGRRNVTGGTAPSRVKRQIEQAGRTIERMRRVLRPLNAS